MIRKILWILSILLIVLVPFSQSFAYRPFGTEDAGVAGKGILQTELSWDYLKWNGDEEQVFLFVLIYGVTDKLELSAEIPYLIHQPQEESLQKGIGDINLVAKYLLIQDGESIPAFTLKGAVKLDNGDYDKGLGSGDKDYSIFAVTSKTFRHLTLHVHLGYTWVGKEKEENLRDIYLYGIALDYGLTDAFHIVGEINGYRHPDRAEPDDPRNALIGITYKISKKLIFDFAVRRGLTESTPDWSTTAGFSITF